MEMLHPVVCVLVVRMFIFMQFCHFRANESDVNRRAFSVT
jgi:hypothetical protein